MPVIDESLFYHWQECSTVRGIKKWFLGEKRLLLTFYQCL